LKSPFLHFYFFNKAVLFLTLRFCQIDEVQKYRAKRSLARLEMNCICYAKA